MKLRFLFGAILLTAMFSFSIVAQDATDFSGDWKLDMGKSDLGERNPVESMTQNVTQTSEKIEITRDAKLAAPPEGAGGGGGRGMGGGGRGMYAGTQTYKLNGDETKVEGERGTTSFKAKKDGSKLQLMQTRNFEGPMGSISVKTTETWELSADGKTLTINSESETPRGSRKTKLVFTKM